MNLNPLLTSDGEEITYRVLNLSLQDADSVVVAQVPLRAVIRLEAHERVLLTGKEESCWGTAYFDFVACTVPRLQPSFAVEFDGLQHQTDRAQIQEDILKNSFCQRAHLPLLRISTFEIEELDRTCILEFIINRYLAWKVQQPRILEEISDYVRRLNPSEVKSLTEGGFLDPSIDPGFIFNMNNPFPGIAVVSDRLLNRFGISASGNRKKRDVSISQHGYSVECDLFPSRTGEDEQGWYSSTQTMHVLKCTESVDVREWRNGVPVLPPKGVEILFKTTQTARMRWALMTDLSLLQQEKPEFPLGSVELVEAMLQRARGTYLAGIPGADIPDVAQWISEYLCLRSVEDWAKAPLRF